MKTSQKLILGAGLIISGFIFTLMVIVRDDIETLFVKGDTLTFKLFEVTQFNRLEFAANYHAEVQSGLDYAVELAVRDSIRVHPELRVVDGTLFFSHRGGDSSIIHARVTLPILKSVAGRTGSEITIRNFQSDSLIVTVEKGCVLKGKENVIKYLTFQAGDALMEWRNNP